MQALLSNFSTCNCATSVIRYCAYAIIIGLTFGCSSSPKNVHVPLLQNEPEDFIVSQKKRNPLQQVEIKNSMNDNRPDWTHKTTFEEKSSVYFTGGLLKGGDYSVTLRCANAEALKAMVQSISGFIRAEFSMFSKGSNGINGGIDRYIQDGIATFTKDLHIQGIKQKESYYEEVFDSVSQTTFYNAWVKLEISKTDYLKAKTSALRRLKDDFENAGEIEAKEKAQRLLDDLKAQVNEPI